MKPVAEDSEAGVRHRQRRAQPLEEPPIPGAPGVVRLERLVDPTPPPTSTQTGFIPKAASKFVLLAVALLVVGVEVLAPKRMRSYDPWQRGRHLESTTWPGARGDYVRDGYTVLPGVFPNETVAHLGRYLAYLERKFPGVPAEHLHHVIPRDEPFWVRIASDPRLLDAAAAHADFLSEGILSPLAHCLLTSHTSHLKDSPTLRHSTCRLPPSSPQASRSSAPPSSASQRAPASACFGTRTGHTGHCARCTSSRSGSRSTPPRPRTVACGSCEARTKGPSRRSSTTARRISTSSVHALPDHRPGPYRLPYTQPADPLCY